jgi:hypothetical protein
MVARANRGEIARVLWGRFSRKGAKIAKETRRLLGELTTDDTDGHGSYFAKAS